MKEHTQKHKDSLIKKFTREMKIWVVAYNEAVTQRNVEIQEMCRSRLRNLEKEIERIQGELEYDIDDFYSEPNRDEIRRYPLEKLCQMLAGTTSNMKGPLEEEFFSRSQFPIPGSFMEIYYPFEVKKAVICTVKSKYVIMDISTWKNIEAKLSVKDGLHVNGIYNALGVPFIFVEKEEKL